MHRPSGGGTYMYGTNSMKSILLRSVKKAHVIGMFVLALGFLATLLLMPSIGNAQDARVAKAMAALKDKTTKLGAPLMEKMRSAAGMLLLCILAQPK